MTETDWVEWLFGSLAFVSFCALGLILLMRDKSVEHDEHDEHEDNSVG